MEAACIEYREVLSMDHIYYLKKFWALYLLIAIISILVAMGASQAATAMAEIRR